MTTILGGKSNVAGYGNGPCEDAKFSRDFDVVYVRPTYSYCFCYCPETVAYWVLKGYTRDAQESIFLVLKEAVKNAYTAVVFHAGNKVGEGCHL